MSSEGQTDREELEQRVRELEATVEGLTPEEVGRRRAMRALAAGVTGAAVGGGGYLAGQGEAAASPSTSDDDGDVGLPNDRVDLFASAVDLADDQKMVLGANDVFAIVYDSAADRLEIRDQVNNTVAYIPRSASGDLTGGGALSDSGTDTDGGDDYQLPNAADNIDLQGDGAIQNADAVDITDLQVDVEADNDVTSSRSIGNWYENTSGQLMLVEIIILISEDIGSANSSKQGVIDFNLHANSSKTDNQVDKYKLAEAKLYTDGSGQYVNCIFKLSTVLPDGHFWKVEEVTNNFATGSIDYVDERRW